MKPTVSILIPAYNAEQWVAAAVRSALSQTWEKKEIIIVDDGSRDQTAAIARQFSSKIVSVHVQTNQGAPAARNKAFELCQGDYIQWLDADDLLAPDKIANQLDVLARSDNATGRTLFSASWGHFFYRPRKARFNPSPLWRDLSPAEWLIRMMETGSHMQTATWLVSRELTEAAGPWDTRLTVNQDGEYFSRVKRYSDSIKFVGGAKVYYRRTGADRVSMIGGSRQKQEALLLSLQLIVKYTLTLEDSTRSRAGCVKYLQKHMIDIRPENDDIAAAMQHLASTLGSRLEFPCSPSAYAWVQRFFGWNAAERLRRVIRGAKTRLSESVDKTLYDLEVLRDGVMGPPWQTF